jgi:L-cysteine desulfidase
MFTLKEIILSEIKPALGCTEPAAIALNGAYLKEYCNNKNITLTINTNLLKNAMYVPIPNTNRNFGADFAFALGFLFGNKKDGLEIFKNIKPSMVKEAKEFAKQIDLKVIKGNRLYIKSKNSCAEVVTEDFHDNITYVKVKEKVIKFNKKKQKESVEDVERWLKQQKIDFFYENLQKEDFSFLKKELKLNIVLAEYGMNNDVGLNVGKRFQGDDLKSKILKFSVSASDARMEGVNLPAMSLTGSGNHGISATLPVFKYGKLKNFSESEIYRAVGLSMLITIYIKLFIGRLSPICGAALASGCGVAGGIAYLETKDKEVSKRAVLNVIQTITGVICDGAKMGCSLKVLLGDEIGYDSAMLAIDNMPVFSDGILESDVSKSIQNLEIIKNSMILSDEAVVEIMKKKLLK